MLTLEAERALSDSIVAGRKQSEDATASDEHRKQGEQAGRQAASQLVEEYLPFIYSLASVVRGRYVYRSDLVTGDDLVQIGVEQALHTAWGFDLSKGRRFAHYSKPAVTKAMHRHAARMSTPFKVDAEALQATWTWMAARDNLRLQLDRMPTDAEVDEATQVEWDHSYLLHGVPAAAEFADTSDPYVSQTLEDSNAGMTFMIEDDQLAAALHHALGVAMDADARDVLMAYLGTDRGYPRTPAETLDRLRETREWDLGIRATTEWIQWAALLLRHPKIRRQLYEALSDPALGLAEVLG